MARQTDGASPAISVVVPARNAEDVLPDLIAALGNLRCRQRWELIVVDDASTDSTGTLARESGARVVRLETQSGPAESRNAGIAAARAPLIAFTDADCQPAPEWLSELAAALGHADIATGPVVPVPGAAGGAFARTLRITEESPLFETANLAVTRDMAERVGGFEAFAPSATGGCTGLRPAVGQGHFGEDAVFGWRARRLGARTAFVDGALVYHAVFPRGPRGYIAERWRLRFFPALVRELPELREELTLRIFLSRSTALFDVAVVGLFAGAATRRRWPVIAAAPYAARRLTWPRWWARSTARRNLAVSAGDAVGFAALVTGSVAARRLLI